MREKLYVHSKLADGSTTLVGQSIRDFQKGIGAFKYAPAYLARRGAYPLDPINLPLDEGVKKFAYDRNNPGLPGVLLDAGPDDWGRKLLSWYKNPPPATAVEFLLAGSGNGIGALRFTDTPAPPAQDTPLRPFDSLEDMLHTAQAVDRGAPASEFMDAGQDVFFDRGVSLGGARPKTLIYHEGAEWIAKMPRRNDPYNNPLIEHLSMQMARLAGINTASTTLASSKFGDVLLVKRFDWEQNQHSHFLSLNSLINVWAIQDRNEEDFSYDNIVRLTNRISGSDNAPEVFRRMLFNIACGNTDDHMNNHAMIRRPNSHHYELSPAYDITPNTTLVGSHNISVGPMGTTPAPDNLLAAAALMHISREDALATACQVKAVTQCWRAILAQGGASENDQQQLNRSFSTGNHALSQLIQRLNGPESIADSDISAITGASAVAPAPQI